MLKKDEYPDINLYYIHGYKSSPNGAKGVLFKKKLDAMAIKYRDCEPEELIISSCLNRINITIKNDKNIVLLGSSLGGFLAASVAIDNSSVKKLILINPAIPPPSTNFENFNEVPKRIHEAMVEHRLFEKKIFADIIILRSTQDEVIPDSWVLNFAKYQEATVMFFHDDHRFSKNLKKLPLIISNLLKN
jgi:predicted esterase YcpF (UPF0227 family)